MSVILESARPRVAGFAPMSIDRLTAYRLDRTHHLPDLRPAGGSGGLVLLHAVQGSITLSRTGGLQVLSPGDLIVLDIRTLAAAEVRVEGEGIALAIPRDCLEGRPARFDHALAVVVTTTSGAPSLVAHVLKGVGRQILRADTEGLDAAAAHILGLVELALRHAAPREPAHYPSRHVLRAMQHIDENLADIGLGPEDVARHTNVSIRTLHRCFEAEGTTIGQWIKTRRLEQCRRDLADPALAHMTVGSIGAQWGLWDAAHFSRAFKQWLGLSPSAYRVAQNALTTTRGNVPA